MSKTEKPTVQSLQVEISNLQEDLQMRDQLVQQLSQELFRLVKGKTDLNPGSEVPEEYLAQMRVLREQLLGVEEQVAFYQEELAKRDETIEQMERNVQELSDRSGMLEQVIQELPEIYRQKFGERMAPVKDKVEILQRENRKLHAELQSANYRLAVRTRRRSGRLELPNFLEGKGENVSLPTFGNA